MTTINNTMTATIHAAMAIILCVAAHIPAASQEMHSHDTPAGKPPPFIASTEKSFPALMDDAMAVMDYGMRQAPMNGMPEHDFLSMMIPHHQGAIDMAKAILLYTKDPELTNLAQGIITEQQNEIRLMQAWLQRKQQDGAGKPAK